MTSGDIVRVGGRVRSPAITAVAGLGALAVAMGIGRFAFTPILPMMQEDGLLTVAEGGWLASANYVGYLLGALSALVVRVPLSVAIRVGLVVIGLTTLAMGFEHRFSVWVVLRALAGVASAWVMISVSSWALARLVPLRRPVLNGTVFAGVGTGIAAAGAVCLVLMAAQASAALAWIGLGLLALSVAAVAWLFFTPERTVVSPGARPRPSFDHWTAEDVRLVFCYGAFGFGYIIPATFLPVMARQEVPDPRMFGWAWPVFGLAAAASTFSGTVSEQIGGNRRLWLLSQLVMALGVSIPVAFPGLTGIMVAALCVGGTFMVNTMAGMQEARHARGSDATGLMAAMTAAFALGQILGPLVVSYAIGVGSAFSTPLLIAASVLTASAITLATVGRGPSTRFVESPADASRRMNGAPRES